MLVESSPKLSSVAVLWGPDTGPVQLDTVQKAARTLNVQLEVEEVHRASDFDAAFLIANQRGVVRPPFEIPLAKRGPVLEITHFFARRS